MQNGILADQPNLPKQSIPHPPVHPSPRRLSPVRPWPLVPADAAPRRQELGVCGGGDDLGRARAQRRRPSPGAMASWQPPMARVWRRCSDYLGPGCCGDRRLICYHVARARCSCGLRASSRRGTTSLCTQAVSKFGSCLNSVHSMQYLSVSVLNCIGPASFILDKLNTFQNKLQSTVQLRKKNWPGEEDYVLFQCPFAQFVRSSLKEVFLDLQISCVAVEV